MAKVFQRFWTNLVDDIDIAAATVDGRAVIELVMTVFGIAAAASIT